MITAYPARLFSNHFFCLVFLISPISILAQYSISATLVETWETGDPPASDFNLNSSYVYLINGQALEKVFSGENLRRSQRKQLGIEKGDYPQYMYLAVGVKNPSNQEQELTIPLMIHDVRDPKNTSRVMEYGGRLLENIPDEELKAGDIVAKVKFEAFRGNSSKEFWEKTAKISIDLGKTATSLLQAPLTGGLLGLTNQIIPQLDKGLNSMEKVEEPQKMTSEFYIKLLEKELSALYAERLVKAMLYEVHWDISRPRPTSYFVNKDIERVDDFKEHIYRAGTTYILVVNTKAEYNTDHSQLVYNQSYIEKKSRDFRKIRNVEKKQVEKAFLETLKLAVELRKQIDVFQNSLNTKYPDWLAYSKIIDLHHDIQTQRRDQLKRLQGQSPDVVEKYTRLHRNVANDVDLWFTIELLTRAQEIATYLFENEPAPVYASFRANELYHQIELLDFYRDRVQQTQIQGKLPKEIETLRTYSTANRLLRLMEEALYNKAFRVDKSLDPGQQKEWLLDRASNLYPLCAYCAQRVGEEIVAIENATHEENIRTYKDISAIYYNQLECFERIHQALEDKIQANRDSLTMSPYMLDALKADKSDLEKLSQAYTDLVGRDYARMSPQELSDLLSQFFVNREKMQGLIRRLRVIMEESERLQCL